MLLPERTLGIKRTDGSDVMRGPAALPHVCPPLGSLSRIHAPTLKKGTDKRDYPARRVGGEWLCSTCPSGPYAVVVPSGCRTSRQLQRWMQTSWWNWHSSTQLLTEVVPPSALWFRWCTSHQAAGRPHLGQAQPRSLRWTARRMLAGMESEWPMSSGTDGVLKGGARRVVRSQAARPAGPETKSMASRAMAYRSACAASGVNRSRARPRARAAARAAPAPRAWPPVPQD